MSDEAARLTLQATSDAVVSAILLQPREPRALFVYGHGAGAGMEHPFMERSALALQQRGIATYRYNFPYMERRSGRPDFTPVLLATVRAAVTAAANLLPGLPLVAGGKSMGGRMTSLAQAESPLPDVRGIAFVGFPLHRPKQLNTERANHLATFDLPLLFLQGTRDEMADMALIHTVATGLGERATLEIFDGADHSFHVLKRSGLTDEQVLGDLADRLSGWILKVTA